MITKKIYIFEEVTPAGVYGIGTFLKQIKDVLYRKKGIEVHFIYLRKEIHEFCVRRDGNFSYYNIPNPTVFSNYTDDKYYENSFTLLKRYIEVNSESFFFINYFIHEKMIDLIKQSFPQAKVIFFVHYLYWTLELYGRVNQFNAIISKSNIDNITDAQSKIIQLYNKDLSVFQKVDKIICLSEQTKSILKESYKIAERKLSVVHNTINDKYKIKDDSSKIQIREKLNFNPKDNVILFVGRLDKRKGVTELIHAFEEVATKKPDTYLVIIGDGDFKMYLKETKSLGTKIIFTGHLPQEEVCEYYQIADIGVLPSYIEQCSYVAIEMMMFGLPLIGTNAMGINEMIIDGFNGYKIGIPCDGIDIKQLSDKIIALLANQELRGKMSKKSREMYLSKYSTMSLQKFLS
jgi:glycosyltransferase